MERAEYIAVRVARLTAEIRRLNEAYAAAEDAGRFEEIERIKKKRRSVRGALNRWDKIQNGEGGDA